MPIDVAAVDARLLANPGARKRFQPAWGWMCYWVGGKQFACTFTTGPEAKEPYANRRLLSLKCDPERSRELRAERPDAVLPAYYSDGRTWISVDLDADLPVELVLDLCDRSYALVFAKLTKKLQREVLAEAGEGSAVRP